MIHELRFSTTNYSLKPINFKSLNFKPFKFRTFNHSTNAPLFLNCVSPTQTIPLNWSISSHWISNHSNSGHSTTQPMLHYSWTAFLHHKPRNDCSHPINFGWNSTISLHKFWVLMISANMTFYWLTRGLPTLRNHARVSSSALQHDALNP